MSPFKLLYLGKSGVFFTNKIKTTAYSSPQPIAQNTEWQKRNPKISNNSVAVRSTIIPPTSNIKAAFFWKNRWMNMNIHTILYVCTCGSLNSYTFMIAMRFGVLRDQSKDSNTKQSKRDLTWSRVSTQTRLTETDTALIRLLLDGQSSSIYRAACAEDELFFK